MISPRPSGAPPRRRLISLRSHSVRNRLSLSSKASHKGNLYKFFRQIKVHTFGETGPKIVASFLKSGVKLESVDTLSWQDNAAHPLYASGLGQANVAKFAGLCAGHLRRIDIIMRYGRMDYCFIESILDACNREILEELSIQCETMTDLEKRLAKPFPHLHKLILHDVADAHGLLRAVGENQTALRVLEFSCPPHALSLNSGTTRDELRKLISANSNLQLIDIGAVDDKAAVLGSFVDLFQFPKLKTPTAVGLEAACFKAFQVHSKIFRINHKGIWEAVYLDGELVGLDEGNVSVVDADFRTYHGENENNAKLLVIERLYYILCSRKPMNYSTYLEWAGAVLGDVVSSAVSQGTTDSALTKSVLMILGVLLTEFKAPDKALVRQLKKFAKILTASFPDPRRFILEAPEYYDAKLQVSDPLFPAALTAVPWCKKGKVYFTPDQVEELHRQLRLKPHRFGYLIKNSQYDPNAKMVNGEALAEWLVREAVSFSAKNAMIVTWAEFALESCALAGITMSWESTRINYDMFSCLLEHRDALSAMAKVFDSFGSLLEPKYLDLRTNANNIPRIKALFEEHAAAWPDDPPIQTTLSTLSSQVWREVLWQFSNEKINPKDHVQTLHYGAMRSCVLTLVQTFERIPQFVAEFMRGKHGELVQRDPVGIRKLLRDLMPEGIEQPEDCVLM